MKVDKEVSPRKKWVWDKFAPLEVPKKAGRLGVVCFSSELEVNDGVQGLVPSKNFKDRYRDNE